jgi:CheY-like chemotaxis protein
MAVASMMFENSTGVAGKGDEHLSRSVMVVDDEPDFCTVVGELLSACNYFVYKAYSAMEAFQLLDRVKPDLILADVMMPEVDGLAMLRRLRQEPNWNGIPTIVVSARVRHEDRMAAMLAGADAFIAKPFTAKQLTSTIESFLHS